MGIILTTKIVETKILEKQSQKNISLKKYDFNINVYAIIKFT